MGGNLIETPMALVAENISPPLQNQSVDKFRKKCTKCNSRLINKQTSIESYYFSNNKVNKHQQNIEFISSVIESNPLVGIDW